MYKKAGIIITVLFFGVAFALFYFFGGDEDKPDTVPQASVTSSLEKSGVVSATPAVSAEPVVEPTPSASKDVGAVPTTSVVTESNTGALTGSTHIDVGDVTNLPASTNQQDEIVSSSITQIDTSTLGSPSNVVKEVMVVSKKNLILLDTNLGGSDGKQLVYIAYLLGAKNDRNRIALYLNEKSYNGLTIGDKLVVRYKVYTNSAGIVFPVIISAEKAQ